MQDDNFKSVITHVLPHVSVDLISYSAYDVQSQPELFEEAFQFIIDHHNRTDTSPNPPETALYLGEFGLAQNKVLQTEQEITLKNLINVALEFGLRYVIFWETMCNECLNPGEGGCNSGSRCSDPDNPVTDLDKLMGYWLIKPDGSNSWVRDYLTEKLKREDKKSTGDRSFSNAHILIPILTLILFICFHIS